MSSFWYSTKFRVVGFCDLALQKVGGGGEQFIQQKPTVIVDCNSMNPRQLDTLDVKNIRPALLTYVHWDMSTGFVNKSRAELKNE